MNQQGFYIENDILTEEEIKQIEQSITAVPQNNPSFRVNQHLFAIRNLLGEVPALQNLLQNVQLQTLLLNHFPEGDYRCIKAIYFDKPPQSNWVVNWHQDLTINVKAKPASPPARFVHWIQKSAFWSVQPPKAYLQNIVTFRLHLDACHQTNGALKVLQASHSQGITPSQQLNELKRKFTEVLCEVPQGGLLAMSPLLWHASSKNQSTQHRRVVHLEFCNMDLPEGLEWYECF